jgi:hypothetical protein
MSETLFDKPGIPGPRQSEHAGWVGKRVVVERVFYHADGTEDRLTLARGEVLQEPECFSKHDAHGLACNSLHFYRIHDARDPENYRRIVLPSDEQITPEFYTRMEISNLEPAISD